MAAPEVDRIVISRGELDIADDLDMESAVYSAAGDFWDESDGVQMLLGGAEGA